MDRFELGPSMKDSGIDGSTNSSEFRLSFPGLADGNGMERTCGFLHGILSLGGWDLATGRERGFPEEDGISFEIYF